MPGDAVNVRPACAVPVTNGADRFEGATLTGGEETAMMPALVAFADPAALVAVTWQERMCVTSMSLMS